MVESRKILKLERDAHLSPMRKTQLCARDSIELCEIGAAAGYSYHKVTDPLEPSAQQIFAGDLFAILIMKEVMDLIPQERFALPVGVFLQPLMLACLNVL
jgi:hypothetical protein